MTCLSLLRDNDLVPLSEIIPRPNSIYFLETSAASTINPRVACSIESAAKHHPNNSIVSRYFMTIIIMYNNPQNLYKLLS